MKFIRIALALVAIATAATVATLLTSNPPQVEGAQVSAAPLPIVTTTTTEPDFAALAATGPSIRLGPEELEATDEALTRSTSTTTTSTTSTTLAETTTTTAAKTTTTRAPSGTTETTAAKKATTTTQAPEETSDGAFSSSAEREFASAITGYRSSNGLAPLSASNSLHSYARAWAKTIGERGGLAHSNIGALLPPWSAVGENVGVGGSVGQIHDALVGSSAHRDNILGDFTHVGIGVWIDADGRLWVAQVFAR